MEAEGDKTAIEELRRSERRYRSYIELAGRILACLNKETVGTNMIGDVLKLIKRFTGVDAAAIRRREGDDFPYLEADGFPADFVEAENYLCRRDEKGEILYDANGRPKLACLCGSVLFGCGDPALPFFTEGGSFWTNSITDLITAGPFEIVRMHKRDGCRKAGYESVALIPLRSGDEIVGLLQLNDKRRGRFNLEMIHSLEEIGASIGIGMARIRSEQEIEILARLPAENPNPILRVASDGRLLYANEASRLLLSEWDCSMNRMVPDKWRRLIGEVYSSGLGRQLDAEIAGRILSFVVVPVISANYVNLYGIDVTERRHAEESLREYRHHLEELVQTRTAELTRANEKLVREIEERKRLEKEILNISEREQRRIGRELHDSIGQQFTGIAFMMKVLEQKLAHKLSDEAADAEEIKKLVNQAMDQARGLARGLHPVDLDSGSLTAALQELANTTEMMFGVRCDLKCDELVQMDNHETATHLYRISQEAITNAIKHGRAKNIRVQFASGSGRSILTIKNDGLDFPENLGTKTNGMGLQIMDHRADIIGAKLKISKAPEGGTIVSCEFGNNQC